MDEVTEATEPTVYDTLLAASKKVAEAAGGQFKSWYRGESASDFTDRLIARVSEMVDEEFDALPESAREWYFSAADAYNANTERPLPAGFPAEAEPRRRVKLVRPPKPPKARKARKRSTIVSRGQLLRRAVIENENFTKEEGIALLAQHERAPMKPISVMAFIANTKETLYALRALGRLPPAEGSAEAEEPEAGEPQQAEAAE